MPIETSPAPFQDEQAGYSYSGSLSMAPPAAPFAALQSHTPAAAAANTLIAAESGAMATPFKAIAALPEAGYTAPVQHAHRFDNTPPANTYARASIAGYGGAGMGMGGAGGAVGMNGGAMSMYGAGPGSELANAYPYANSFRSGVPGPRPSLAPMPISRSISMPVKPNMMTVPLPSSLHQHELHDRHRHDQYEGQHHHDDRHQHRPRHLHAHYSSPHLDFDDGASDCSYYARPKRLRSTRHSVSARTLRPPRDDFGPRGSRSRSRSWGHRQHDRETAIDSSDSDDESDDACPDCHSHAGIRHAGHTNRQRAREMSMISSRQRLPGTRAAPDSPPDSPLQDYMRRLRIHDERDRRDRRSHRSKGQDSAVEAERGVMSDTEVVRPTPRVRRATDHSAPPSPRTRVGADAGVKGTGKENEREREELYRKLPKDTVDQFKRNRRRSDVHGHGLRPDPALLDVPQVHRARSRLASDVGGEGGRRARHGSLGEYEQGYGRQRVASQRYARDCSPASASAHAQAHAHALEYEHGHRSAYGYAPSAGSYGGARSWVSPSAFDQGHGHGHGYGNASGMNDGYPFPVPPATSLGPEVAHLNPMMSASELGVGVSGVGGPDGRVSQYGLPKYPHQPKVDYRRFMVQRGNADVYLD